MGKGKNRANRGIKIRGIQRERGERCNKIRGIRGRGNSKGAFGLGNSEGDRGGTEEIVAG